MNSRLGKAVDSFLFVIEVATPGQQARIDELSQAVDQDVGGDTFLVVRQKFAEMSTVHEHHVAYDDEAPFVAQHLQSEVDGTA